MIYLIKAYGENKILLKIGYTDNLEKRKHSYITHTPDFTLLQVREGDKTLEQDIQDYFKEFKYNNEWFYFNDKIINEFLSIIPPRKEIPKRKYTKLREEFFEKLNSDNYIIRKYLAKKFLKENRDNYKTVEELLAQFQEKINKLNNNVLDFLNQFYRSLEIRERLKYLCTVEQKFSEQEWKQIFSEIPDYFRNFYLGLGPERCKALGYNYTLLDKEYNTKFFDVELVRNKILTKFSVGNKLSTPEIKATLKDLYIELGYKKTPKASDLEEYFELRAIKLKNSSGKWIHGFEILKER